MKQNKKEIADNKNADAISVNPQKNEPEKNAENKNAAAKLVIPLVFFF